MNDECMPILRFEIEGMKRSIISHIGAVGSDLGRTLDDEITKAVESYPWQQKVDEIVHKEIYSQLKSYFEFGDGHQQIKKTINSAMTETLYKGE